MAMYSRDPSRYITHIHVSKDCLDLPFCREILQRSRVPVAIIKGQQVPGLDGYTATLSQGKRHLLLCRNRGRFFKPCPGTRAYRCCGYQVLNIGMHCPMDCVYCILQAYLNTPWLTFFVNIEDLFAELDQELERDDRFYRIGTGEFTDSLALDALTGLSTRLVPYFGERQNCVLELKTKSTVIDNLQHLDHGGHTLIAWSLNSPPIMGREELRTASLKERLRAAAQVADWGYHLAFHFDPIVLHPDWEEGYLATIDQLFKSVPRDRIAWISLGALRYLPALKEIACKRFPGSRIFYEEYITGLDNKRRYFRSQRVAMYRVLADALRKRCAAHTCLYFCMENDAIWREVFGFTPEEQGGLPAMLDRSIQYQL